MALKTIRPEITGEASVIERFKREIQLARQVTHPNVCRIFDLFHHRSASAEGQAQAETDVTFVTMELLAGETLEDRLRRTGRMSTVDALPLVAQQGDFAGAMKRYEESLAVDRNTGNKSGMAATLNNIAAILHVQGRLAEAES